MPLRKPTNFLNTDFTFTVAGKGVVNNAGDLKLDAADGFFIAPQKGIKFPAITGRIIDFSNIVANGTNYLFYHTFQRFWRADGYLYTGVVKATGYVETPMVWQIQDIAMPFKTQKCTVAVEAPGAGRGGWRFEPGTNAGTAKIVVYAGTSTIGTVIQDNIGAGF